ncbi:sulfite exporter TauE/SafE family protein [Brevibacillus thermoruber]|uniref:Probable membrane transporter protein n=1 Tax=Brevibacillus thermoruber TaxID=33942 RepID=A0A9X3TUN0_9BACL|nr:sulfite exporter TauE/SafE family protein [Brevibacillus thermoruber]MDA5110921.1 sulfite exporter TauE/SafE family protein [Brevibacillus thermoruber]
MTLSLMITLFLIGFAGSFISGLVGIGGSIIKYPMLLYIPPALGLAAYTAHEVSGISAVQVFFATISGVWALRKDKLINYKLVAYMGVAIIIGSFAGGYGGKFLAPETINLVYGVLASIAAFMMFVPNKGIDDIPLEKVQFNKTIAVLAALVVGIASGIVGAAGAFILVPIMLLVLKIPTRMTIASSLAITFISSIGSTVGKVMAGDVLFWPSVIMVVASILAAPLGARLSKRINTKILQAILAVLILGTAVKIWFDILA